MVWTLSDYYGEARQGWPGVSSTYGAFDLAGYEKGAAWWYRSWWRDNTPALAEDRPRPLPGVPNVPACRVWGDRWDQYVGKVNPDFAATNLRQPALPSLRWPFPPHFLILCVIFRGCATFDGGRWDPIRA